MKVCFKATTALLAMIRSDLSRPHPYALERVGFISAGLSTTDSTLLVLAREYRPVNDEDYLSDPSVGAMMGPDAIRKALQWSMKEKVAIFHVHKHHGIGIPRFSDIDLRENAKFVPDFFKVSPHCAHGAIVLSDTAASGHIWFGRTEPRYSITAFNQVGIPLRKWSTR